MPLTEADQRRVDEAEAEAEAAGSTKLLVRSPPDTQKLGSITVMCLILNRTIGMSEIEVSNPRRLTSPQRLGHLCHTGRGAQSHQQRWPLSVAVDFWRRLRSVWTPRLAGARLVHTEVPTAGREHRQSGGRSSFRKCSAEWWREELCRQFPSVARSPKGVDRL